MVKLKLALAKEEENGPGLVTCKNAMLGEEHLLQYLIDCCVQAELTFEAPVHSTTEGPFNYWVNLPKVELEFFTCHTLSYLRFVKQFE